MAWAHSARLPAVPAAPGAASACWIDSAPASESRDPSRILAARTWKTSPARAGDRRCCCCCCCCIGLLAGAVAARPAGSVRLGALDSVTALHWRGGTVKVAGASTARRSLPAYLFRERHSGCLGPFVELQRRTRMYGVAGGIGVAVARLGRGCREEGPIRTRVWERRRDRDRSRVLSRGSNRHHRGWQSAGHPGLGTG